MKIRKGDILGVIFFIIMTGINILLWSYFNLKNFGIYFVGFWIGFTTAYIKNMR